ncbi:MAG: zinc ribbon domain-containing protein [Gemmatimonadales bacterium]
MILELFLIAALAVGVGWIVIGPLLGRRPSVEFEEPLPIEETRRGQALIAIKDLDFDHATGKIADDDYAELREKYVRDAATVIEDGASEPTETVVVPLAGTEAGGPTCRICGPRPESDARFCSSCGLSIVGDGFCAGCGASLPAGARFCEACGVPAASR